MPVVGGSVAVATVVVSVVVAVVVVGSARQCVMSAFHRMPQFPTVNVDGALGPLAASFNVHGGCGNTFEGIVQQVALELRIKVSVLAAMELTEKPPGPVQPPPVKVTDTSLVAVAMHTAMQLAHNVPPAVAGIVHVDRLD